MRLSEGLIKKLKLQDAAGSVIDSGVEHFPPLMSDVCLSNSPKVIAEVLKARLLRRHALSSEIVGYPRKAFGIRPIAVSSIMDRTLYRALVGTIEDRLPDSSRGDENWRAHRGFGLQGTSRYIVEFDIASCYEYVDHEILGDELALRTMEPDVIEAIGQYLNEMHGRKLGLPQLSLESDRLADAYLEIMNRSLRRSGFVTSRFADDFRTLARTQERANWVIEEAAKFAREIGLVLSNEKTGIYRRETLAKRNKSEEEVLAKYFGDVEEALRQSLVLLEAEYTDEDEDAELDFDPDKIEFEAYHSILADWERGRNSELFGEDWGKDEHLGPLIGRSLRILRDDESRSVSSNLLRDIVYDNATRLQAVVKYVISRSESGWDEDDNWRTIKLLTEAQRQSPWAKLWLLHGVSVVEMEVSEDDPVIEWVKRQLFDRHELVRGEAAWLLAELNMLEERTLIGLFRKATDLTKPLLAAAATKSSMSEQLVKALKGENPLTKEAAQWVEKSSTSSN